MKKNNEKNFIPISLMFGVSLGNAIGLIVGTLFLEENIGVGLVIGNAIGVSLGLAIGALINYFKK